MKLLFTLLLLFSFEATAFEDSSIQDDVNDSIEIYFFVAETCPICQYYTAKINQIESDYPNHTITLVFPNDLSNDDSMDKYKKKYKLTARMQRDPDHELVQKFGVTVTPEVVVYHPESDSVLYQGRIDDNYYRVGKRKQVVQSDDLINALQAIKNEIDIETAKTTPVGCFISQKPKK